jgi:hypothetical protein
MSSSRLSLSFVVCALSVSAWAQTALATREDLFRLVVSGSTCRQLPHGNRTLCEYKVGKLEFALRNEENGIYNIAFRHSDQQDDFYAVHYGGCVAVVPGLGHPRNYEAEYVAYVAPQNGRVYRDLTQCKAAEGP